MGRPADWSPLAASDPVPGDPAGIAAEAAHLLSVAEQIASQVAALRKIAGGQSDEKGQHAAKLQSAASDTAGKLEKVTGRYRETAAALNGWVPELEHAQAQSLKALSQAQEAHGRQRANQPVQRPPHAHLTAADHHEDQARSQALAQANAAMAEAQAMMAAAVSHRDQAAAQAASRIRSAISAEADSWLNDVGSFFSSVGSWVKDHWVPLLKNFCTALEIIVTVLAFVALFIPGLDIVAALLILSVIATLGRTWLAVTGNGSWLDVGLDVVACLTLGLSSYLFSPALARAAESAFKTGESLVAGERAATAAEYMTKLFGSTAGRLIGTGRATEICAQAAAEDVPKLASGAENMGYWSKVGHLIKAGGSFEDAESSAKLSAAVARYGSDPRIADAAAKGGRALAGLRASGITSWGGAISGLVGGGGELDNAQNHAVFHINVPYVQDVWGRWEDGSTRAVLPQFKMATGG